MVSLGSDNLKVATIILARGGSKGLPGKNMKSIGGLSLIARSVSSSKAAGFATFVSSDSEEILREAIKYGAATIKRPELESSDTATSESALVHALERPELETFDTICFIQPTSPFISVEDLVLASQLVINGAAGTVFAAKEDLGFSWEEVGGVWEPAGHSRSHRPRRQDLKPRVVETGAFYIFSKTGFLECRSRFSGKVMPLIVDPRFAVDIDTYADLEIANAMESLWREKQGF